MLSACTVCWCLNGPIMWNSANSSPSPRPFSIKTPSFQASWSNPLSPAWDTFRPGAPPLNYLMFLHQDGCLIVILECTLNRELSGGFPTRFFQIQLYNHKSFFWPTKKLILKTIHVLTHVFYLSYKLISSRKSTQIHLSWTKSTPSR